MLLECQNCGAPLDVAEGASSVRCNYCRQKTAVARSRTVAMQTPEGWAPPPQWTPHAESSLAKEPLAYRPVAAVRAVVRWLAFSGVATVAIGGFIAWRVVGAVSSATGGVSGLVQSDKVQGAIQQAMAAVNAANAAAQQLTAGETVPLHCAGNDDVTITGKNLVLPSGSPVVASGNCTLRLIGCTVSGATAIIARNNSKVTIQGGSVSGTGPAVALQDNAVLDVSGGARLSGEATITAANNATARVRDSSVSGQHIAIRTTHNASVDAAGATVQGQVVGAARPSARRAGTRVSAPSR
jgi:LSD1 subclass zinc finger protein